MVHPVPDTILTLDPLAPLDPLVMADPLVLRTLSPLSMGPPVAVHLVLAAEDMVDLTAGHHVMDHRVAVVMADPVVRGTVHPVAVIVMALLVAVNVAVVRMADHVVVEVDRMDRVVVVVMVEEVEEGRHRVTRFVIF